jgi:hypothetical protein
MRKFQNGKKTLPRPKMTTLFGTVGLGNLRECSR